MKLCLKCNLHFDNALGSCPNDGSVLVETGKDPILGRVINNRYKILSVVGQGSMGVVYRAIQISTGREMAFKIIHSSLGASQESLKRFRREAKAISTVKHPNLVTLFDYGAMEDGQPYIVTEFVKGVTLARVLSSEGYLNSERALPIIQQVCSAVGEAHRLRIIHRDIKPENIVLEETVEAQKGRKDAVKGDFVKVVDFGVAKLSTEHEHPGSWESLTMDGKVCGSPAYMSPEQCKGEEIDYRSDIYSLGVVIFETLTGKRPFSAEDVMGVMFLHVSKRPPSMASMRLDVNYPSALEAAVAKSLSKNPDDRQQSTEELWEDVNTAYHGQASKIVVEAPSTWIPFQSSRPAVREEAPPPRHQSHRPPPSMTATADSMTAYQDSRRVIETTSEFEPITKKEIIKRKFEGIFIAAGFTLLLAGAVVFINAHMNNDHGVFNNVGQLMNQEKYKEAIDVLEDMQKEGQLTRDDQERINALYIDIGDRYAKKRQFVNAISVVEHVAPTSKQYSRAKEHIKKYRRHVGS